MPATVTNEVSSASHQAPPELRAYLAMLWRRKWIFLLCITLLPAAVYAISSRAPKTYQASATVQIQTATADQLASDSFVSVQTLARIARLIQTPAVARRVASRLPGPRPDAGSLLGEIGVTTDPDGGFVTITATGRDARRVPDIANGFASVIASARVAGARAEVDRTINEVERTLRQLSASNGAASNGGPPQDVSGQVRDLTLQLQQLRVLRAAQGNTAQIIQGAATPGAQVSPHPRRNAVLALVVAALLGFGLVYAFEVFDRRIRKTEELEPLVGASLLGVVPASAFRPEDTAFPTAEAFHTLRASLTYFNVDRALNIVVITSPVKGDGKTTVATNLAFAIARAGKRVILVDADLRHPQVDARIGPGAESGLGAVLSGEQDLDATLVDVMVDDGRLQILPSGPPPPNPSELIASHTMQLVLTKLVARSDIVLIDTPPAVVLSDALPLFPQSSGVVVVARLNHTPRRALAELCGIVTSARGTLLGVVATGATERSGYYSYGDYYPSENGKPAADGTSALPAELSGSKTESA